MRFDSFIGPTYGGRSAAADSERSINLYLESIESPEGATKTRRTLLSKPGLNLFAALANSSQFQIPSLDGLITWDMRVIDNVQPNGAEAEVDGHSSTSVAWGAGVGAFSFTGNLSGTYPATVSDSIAGTGNLQPHSADLVSTIVTLYIQGYGASGPYTPPSRGRIYDVYLALTYASGTALLRPTTMQIVGASSTSSILNPQNAFDGDQTTFAEIDSTRFTGGALSYSAELQLTDFRVVSTTGTVPMISTSGGNSVAVRALCEINGRGFAIASNGPNNYFFENHADGTSTAYPVTTGTSYRYALPGDTRPQMEASQTQILILSGGQGFIFDLKANTLSAITAAGFPAGAVKAGFLDGYFIVLEPNSQTFAISGLNDGTSWDALDFGDAEGEPGNVTSFVVDHRQIWFLGNNHGEIYYNSGDANFPISRLEGAFMEQGCSAIDSAFRCDNTIFWKGGNRDGENIFWRANGYTPERISTYAIEALVDSFGDTSDCSGYCYQEGGHTFARWDFPSANGGLGASLLYDVGEQSWHERGWWDGSLGQYRADLARCHMFVFGKHLVGDYRSGNIYVQSMDYATDAGNPIRRLRAAPDLANGGKWTFYGEFRLLMETGVGLDGGVIPGTDPQCYLQISNDGGKTWEQERPRSMGPLGNYRTTVRWTPNGRSNNRVFRWICSEPVKVVLIAADLDVTA